MSETPERPEDDVDAQAAATASDALDATASQTEEDGPSLEEQVEQANNKLLRAQAEVETVRKRAQREIEQERRYAALPLVRELLSVMDNLQLAINAASHDNDSAGMLEGVKLVAQQLSTALESYGCKQIPALGQAFDPNHHEAVGQEPSDEVPASHVSRELRTGFQLHDRVVRPSQVFVSTGPASPAGE